MRKKIYTFWLGMGATVAASIPIAAVVSCGCSKKENTKVVDTNDKTKTTNPPGGTNTGTQPVPKPIDPPVVNPPVTGNKPTTGSGGTMPTTGGTKPTTGEVVPTTGGVKPTVDGTGTKEVTVVEVPTREKLSETNIAKTYAHKEITDSLQAMATKVADWNLAPESIQFDQLVSIFNTDDRRTEIDIVDKLSKDMPLNLLETKGLLYLVVIHRTRWTDAFPLDIERVKKVVETNAQRVLDRGLIHKWAKKIVAPKYGEVNKKIDVVDAAYLITEILEGLQVDYSEFELKLLATKAPLPRVLKEGILGIDGESYKLMTMLANEGAVSNLAAYARQSLDDGIASADQRLLKDFAKKFFSFSKIVIDETNSKITDPEEKAEAISRQERTFALIDSIKVDNLVDSLVKLINKGLFAMDSNLIQAIIDSENNIWEAADGILRVVFKTGSWKGIYLKGIEVLEKAISEEGISSIAWEELENIIDEVSSTFDVELESTYKELINNLLYTGWESADLFADDILGFIPKEVLDYEVRVLGKVGDSLRSVFKAIYEGSWFSGTALDIARVYTRQIGRGLSPLVQKGMLNLNEEEFKEAIKALIQTIKNSAWVLDKISDYVQVEPKVTDLLGILSDYDEDESNIIANALHKLIFSDFTTAYEETKSAFDVIYDKVIKRYGENNTIPLLWIKLALFGEQKLSVDEVRTLIDAYDWTELEFHEYDTDSIKKLVLYLVKGRNSIVETEERVARSLKPDLRTFFETLKQRMLNSKNEEVEKFRSPDDNEARESLEEVRKIFVNYLTEINIENPEKYKELLGLGNIFVVNPNNLYSDSVFEFENFEQIASAIKNTYRTMPQAYKDVLDEFTTKMDELQKMQPA